MWQTVAAQIAIAVLVGIGSSWLTTQIQIATMRTRLDHVESDIKDLDDVQSLRRDDLTDLRERIGIVEAKIDILLDSLGVTDSELYEEE